MATTCTHGDQVRIDTAHALDCEDRVDEVAV